MKNVVHLQTRRAIFRGIYLRAVQNPRRPTKLHRYALVEDGRGGWEERFLCSHVDPLAAAIAARMAGLKVTSCLDAFIEIGRLNRDQRDRMYTDDTDNGGLCRACDRRWQRYNRMPQARRNPAAMILHPKQQP